MYSPSLRHQTMVVILDIDTDQQWLVADYIYLEPLPHVLCFIHIHNNSIVHNHQLESYPAEAMARCNIYFIPKPKLPLLSSMYFFALLQFMPA